MPRNARSIAIVGAGIGGLAAAAALRQVGIDVRLYEQAEAFERIGAGIQISPNSVRVLRKLGLGQHLTEMAYRPLSLINRDWNSGAVTLVRPLGDEAEAKYGAPHYVTHRGDLHAALADLVPEEIIERGHELVDVRQSSDAVILSFASGARVEADLVIGADGVHSVVREALFGAEAPVFTGRVAYRTTFPSALLKGLEIDGCAKWWGPDRHIVIYYLNPREDEIYFVTSTPAENEESDSWSTLGDMDELRLAYKGFHPIVRSVLEACPKAHKWALFERSPMPEWGRGRITLLGDSCHPMTPYMAQGAASAIEDAVILSRCLADAASDEWPLALRRYERNRQARTARIQSVSRSNDMNLIKAELPHVYSYDAWSVPLAV